MLSLLSRDLYKIYGANNKDKNKKLQEFCHKIALVYIPIVVLCFAAIYWFIGLRNAQFF